MKYTTTATAMSLVYCLHRVAEIIKPRNVQFLSFLAFSVK